MNNQTDPKLIFTIYCIEEYKQFKNLKALQVVELFEKFGVFEYINDCYGALHTYGRLYLMNDLDEYISIHSSVL